MVFEHDFKSYPELTNSQLDVLLFVSPHPQMTEDFVGVVEKVHDGDTVTVSISTRDFSFPVRLLDIDAPELSEGGVEAREYLRSRVLGETVFFSLDSRNRVDKYGRLLARLLHGGFDLGQEMLGLGYVVPFGKKHEGEPESVDKIFSVRQWFGGF